ncbi:hypothetical protein [Mesoterricola silvestris]|uniref:Uncharacterized protein n=1 Tax=Mesoterricola silvestris TaxID=2927979 RepID=A0AA48GV17_9BACT|nr:hypothetical protein [Mesoterricola silvestris]BDU72346.1 hypothetical protein METEAL_15200 [Mesoterricola silvestris]
MADDWTKRSLFRAWVKEAKGIIQTRIPKATNIDVADALGLSYNSLKKYLSVAKGNKHRPGETSMKLLGAIVKKDWRTLLDDPSEAPMGIEAEVWDSAAMDARQFANDLFHEGKDLTPEQRKAILEMVRTMGKPNIGHDH